ncbi:O-succinylhomoserine sulfhydrylase [Methylocapsa palsarum]|uniref:O-succinylhomoserine sulfhydrylase n=1 Tax=Methylocapsa palsarum TaxID=1612308 RepID=A0A1I4B182_9HYPH|nr:O-succinylhomoserine sulfhydrylase [Methylocapsa palsarum]SFK61917.1 O-succinylhomoserine sulfhydrylase [Methylocapsa palsarum]
MNDSGRKPDFKTLRPATRLVHGGTQRSQFGETSEAIFLTQGFVYPDMETAEARFKGDEPGYVYSRYANPTVTMFEERLALLEGAEAARATASGMAAVTTALMAQLKAGDHVVAARALFGACLYVVEDLLPRFGVASTLVDGADLAQWRAAMRPETRIAFLESPTNPRLDVYDIAAIADIAHQNGARLVVDNVFASPILQKPMALGADCVVYSATKHIDGQGRCLGGAILGSSDLIENEVHGFLRQTGPTMSPFNAWVLLKSLETLPLRVNQQMSNAARVADFLADHRQIRQVIYPGRPDHPQADIVQRQMLGGGTLVALELSGGKAAAFAFANRLAIIKISNNLGDAKSLITHPATTTHQRLTPEARAVLGVNDGLLRLSVGLEDADDLIEDLAFALDSLDQQGLAAE